MYEAMTMLTLSARTILPRPVWSGTTVFVCFLQPHSLRRKIENIFLSISFIKGVQWLRGRVLGSRQRAAGSRLTGVTALCL